VRGLNLFAAAFLALTGTANAATFDAGALTVRVQDEPFALEFVDGADGDVLRSVGGGLPAPDSPNARYGPLGFSFDMRRPVVNNAYFGYYAAAEAETIWFHATKVAGERTEGGRLILDLETNDPEGHRIELTIEKVGDGGARLSAKAVGPLAQEATLFGAAFQAVEQERYIGFGSRSNAVDQTGQRVFSWAEEGPFSGGNYDEFLRENIPSFTFPSGPTATNFPIPWLVSTRGIGVLIDKTERSYFNLRNHRQDAWQAEVEAPELKLTVFAGPNPRDVVRRYSDYAGRQPAPEPWFFGPWVQPTLESRPYELAERFRADDVPVSLLQTYTHYLPCGAQRGREKEEKERIDRYHALGYRITTYFNPHICLDYQPVYGEAAERGLFVKNAAGEPYILSNPFTADEQVSELDFTQPAAVEFFRKLQAEAVAAGHDGWMEDFGEYTPTDSVFADGRTGREMHNLYPVLYHAASYPGKLAVFIRSGFHGVQPYARVVWGGDPTEDWSCTDGLCAAVHQLVNMGLSGVAYQGSDIGGFHAIVNPRTDDELNIRWLQVGAFSGVMRTQANGYSLRNDRARRSQVWHPAVYPRWRRYAKLRTQLYPYVDAASREYLRTGMPIARHLSLMFPADAKAAARQTEFKFGPDLLVAPVLEEGARERKLYLPPGRWIEMWRGVRYDRRTGGLRMVRAGAVDGGREVTVRAPIYEIPVFVREGAVIPLLPPDVDTLAGIGSEAGVVDLEQRARRRSVLAFPKPARVWRWRARGRRTHYRLQASQLRRPCSVRVGGRRVPWRWFRNRRVLHAEFTTRNAQLTVRSCR